MAMFEFKLRPVADLARSEHSFDRTWFGLTDGCFHVKLGAYEMFKLHPDRLKELHPNFSIDESGWEFQAYYDYQVARLFHNLIWQLRWYLQPIDRRLLCLYESPQTLKEWLLAVENARPADINDPWHDLPNQPDSWYFYRRLTALGTVKDPYATLLRNGDDLHIYWNEVDSDTTGTAPYYDCARGQLLMPVTDFLSEVYAFQDRLMDQMQERIFELDELQKRIKLDIDLFDLQRQHEVNKNSLAKELLVPTPVDWDRIVEVNQRLFPQFFK